MENSVQESNTTGFEPFGIEHLAAIPDVVDLSFADILGESPQRRDLYRKRNHIMAWEVTLGVGFTGDTSGFMAVNLPASLALSIAAKVAGRELAGGVNDETFSASLSQFMGNIGEGLKTRFGDLDYHVDFALPTLILGATHEVYHRYGTTCTCIESVVGDSSYVVEVVLPTEDVSLG